MESHQKKKKTIRKMKFRFWNNHILLTGNCFLFFKIMNFSIILQGDSEREKEKV